MSTAPRSRLLDYATARDALLDLCEGMMGICTHSPECFEVTSERMPEPFRGLLVHDRHMTEVLGEHFGTPPSVRVVKQRIEGELYTRKIVLSAGEPRRDVELGVVRMDLRYLSPVVRREVLAGQRPLGEILIRHDVLRRIEPRWFFSFPAHCMEIREAGVQIGQRVYGRVGTIYCNNEPAMELLEIVTAV